MNNNRSRSGDGKPVKNARPKKHNQKPKAAPAKRQRRSAGKTVAEAEPQLDGSLEDRLAEANANTQAVLRVVEAVSKANTVMEAAKVGLDTVRSAFGWAYGSYWVLDPAERLLKFRIDSGSVGEEFRRV